jgi:N-acyl-D-aspartate/D-glutamate deacylase
VVFDGTGSAPAVNDVAIADGRIPAIGPTLRASARAVIAADAR